MAADANSVKRSQKEWAVPQNSKTSPHLTLYNSLTRQKEKFVPVDGKKVKWYSCGPTVYDSSHMGHARSFLSLDILRRVITNYFGYDVQFIMNITDIDDKIIKRARQRHLLEEYLGKGNEKPSVEKVCQDVIEALRYYTVKFENEIDPDKRTMQEKMIAKVQHSADHLETALRKKEAVEIETAKGTLLNSARDILSDWLDSQFGKDIVDHSVFDKLAKTYETEFLEDMARLHVLPADVLTRVSEYVPEIVRYVEKIIANGYGYATKDGSVYFDSRRIRNIFMPSLSLKHSATVKRWRRISEKAKEN